MSTAEWPIAGTPHLLITTSIISFNEADKAVKRFFDQQVNFAVRTNCCGTK